MSGGVTTNYGLKKPNFNQRPWDTDINGNFDLIDALLYAFFQVPNVKGVWKNSTAYNVGDNVFDAQALVFYYCSAANTSASTGSFAADRAARPTLWTLTLPQLGAVRYDQGQVLTSGQIQQALTNLSTLSTAQMIAKFVQFDAAQTLTDPQIAQAITNLKLYDKLLRYDTNQTLTYTQQLQVLNNLLIDGTESTLASADTTDIGNAGSQNVVVSGDVTITSFGTRPNKYKLIRFTGKPLLTNGSNLVLPGGANIQAAAGDTCVATSDAAGVWYVRAYTRATGRPVADAFATQTFTSAISASSGSLTSASPTCRYRKLDDKLVWISFDIIINNNGTGAGAIIATLPVAVRTGGSAILVGRENQGGGKMLQGLAAGTTVNIFNYDNTYPAVTGTRLLLNGVYEID